MKILDHDTFSQIQNGASILEKDRHGVKVLLLQDGNILKLFRRKRLISSALWSPYAERFAKNAERLLKRGILAPRIIEVFRIPSIARDAVLYEPIPGKTLRQLHRENLTPEHLAEFRQMTAEIIRKIHDQGIYFRSLHLGNLVLTPEGKLGLIDISDLQIYPFPLPSFLRQRNMARILRISSKQEKSWFDPALILTKPQQ